MRLQQYQSSCLSSRCGHQGSAALLNSKEEFVALVLLFRLPDYASQCKEHCAPPRLIFLHLEPGASSSLQQPWLSIKTALAAKVEVMVDAAEVGLFHRPWSL